MDIFSSKLIQPYFLHKDPYSYVAGNQPSSCLLLGEDEIPGALIYTVGSGGRFR